MQKVPHGIVGVENTRFVVQQCSFYFSSLRFRIFCVFDNDSCGIPFSGGIMRHGGILLVILALFPEATACRPNLLSTKCLASRNGVKWNASSAEF